MTNEEILKKNGGRRYDVIIQNPPYSGVNTGDTIYIHFINKCIELTNKLITISPLGGFLNHNEHGSAANKAVKLHEVIDKYKPEIEEVNNEFDAGIKGKIGISFFDKENIPDKIIVKYLNGHIIEVDNQMSIIDNSNEYLQNYKDHLFKYMLGENSNEFLNVKWPHIYKGRNENEEVHFIKDNLYEHMNCVKNIEGYAIYKKLKEDSYDHNKLYIFLFKINAAFGEYLYKQTYNNAIEYDDNNKIFHQSSVLYIKLNEDELEKSKNICSYLKTDFVRLNLKLNARFYHWYLRYMFVPWLDFSKEWTDEELFKMIGMEYNKEEIDKILNGK